MAYRAVSPWLYLLGASLLACAKGGLPENSATTFGSGVGGTQAMTSSSPSDPATSDTASDTESQTDGTSLGEAESGPGSGPGGSEVGGEDCGNGALDGVEQCDGDDLGGSDCISVGFAGGTLACTGQCTFDTSGCADAVCGDGVVQMGESCDCAQAACAPAQLGNQSCTGLPAPGGGNYSGGTLGCTAQCGFDESGCTACGNGVLDAGEACDGANLAGQTCVSQGFDAGSLSCAADCSLATGSCIDYVCGNGVCDPNEDSCSCAADCPDDPNSCGVPCQCGSSGGNCFCDQACLSFGDCCFDGPC